MAGLCNGFQNHKDVKSCSCIFQKDSEAVFALPLLSARIMRLPGKARKVSTQEPIHPIPAFLHGPCFCPVPTFAQLNVGKVVPNLKL